MGLFSPHSLIYFLMLLSLALAHNAANLTIVRQFYDLSTRGQHLPQNKIRMRKQLYITFEIKLLLCMKCYINYMNKVYIVI